MIVDNYIMPQSFNSSVFCVNPFFALEIPENNSCCHLPRQHDIDSIRTKMLQGRRPDECSTCWKLEDVGQISDRIIKNQCLDHWSDTDISIWFEKAKHGDIGKRLYKIDTSNVCNSSCVTCNSSFSNTWAKLENLNDKNWEVSLKELDEKIDYTIANVIGFRGGEPFLSATNFAVLQRLIDAHNTNCWLNFTTNGSVRPTARQLKLLKQFVSVDLCFSIDGIGSVFEYMRYPLKWQTILDNINWARDNEFTVSVSYTLSNLNIFYHSQTIDFFQENDLPYFINPVNYPKYFMPNSLPQQFKQKIIDQNPDTENFLCNHNLDDDVNWSKCLSEISRQDNLKGIDIKNYLPELSEIFYSHT